MTKLTADEATEAVVGSILEIAPDVADELPSVPPTADLWEQLDLDSVDHQNVMVELFRRTGVDIAERDYARLRSVSALAEHITANAG